MTPRSGLLLLLTVLALGCASEDLPKTYPVNGVVSLEKAPVKGAVVTFTPTSGGQEAVATTDKSGRYTLRTIFAPDNELLGAVPGEYAVTIRSGTAQDPSPAKPSAMNQVPGHYGVAGKSGLTASVKAVETNEIDFPLSTAESD